MAPASAQTHAHNPASYGAYPECVSLRSRPKVPNQDPRAASGPCLLHVPALQERSPRSPVCEARRHRKDPPVLRPQRPLFASPRPREQALQERTPQPLLQPGNSADSSCFILISCLSHSRNSFPIFRKDSFGFRDQLSHKFGCVGRMAKTCVLTRPDCHELQSSLSGSGCRNSLGQSMLLRKWLRRTAHISEFVHQPIPDSSRQATREIPPISDRLCGGAS